MRVAVNSHALPIYKKNRIALLLFVKIDPRHMNIQ